MCALIRMRKLYSGRALPIALARTVLNKQSDHAVHWYRFRFTIKTIPARLMPALIKC